MNMNCIHTIQAKSHLFPAKNASFYRSYLNYKSNSHPLWKQNIDHHLMKNWFVQWEIPSQPYQPSCVFMMEVSDDKQFLVFSRESAEIELWDVPSRRCTNKFSAHDDIVTSFAFFHGDSTSFFTASLDKKICLWRNYEKQAELTQHQDWLRCLSLSKHNHTLLSG